ERQSPRGWPLRIDYGVGTYHPRAIWLVRNSTWRRIGCRCAHIEEIEAVAGRLGAPHSRTLLAEDARNAGQQRAAAFPVAKPLCGLSDRMQVVVVPRATREGHSAGHRQAFVVRQSERVGEQLYGARKA